MKKLMIVAAVALLAGMSQAASVSWGNTSSSKLVGLDGTTAITAANATAWGLVSSNSNRLLFSRCYDLTAGTFTHEKILLFVGAYRVATRILSHGFFTSFALCLYQFLKVLLMSLEESKIVWKLCLTGVRES